MKRLVTLLLVVAAGSVAAQTVYRCGNSYSREPCEGGQAIDASDPRTAQQRADALRVAADERRRAAELARERRSNRAIPPSAAKPASAPVPKHRHRHKVPAGPVKPI